MKTKMTWREVTDHLMISSMKHNYANLIKTRTKEEADRGMATIFEGWEDHREAVIFWYENDMLMDESGEIKVTEQLVTLTDCRLSNYDYDDQPEYEGNVKTMEKRLHFMDDHNGKTHTLPISPYVHLTPDGSKAFTEIAIRLGRVPTREDNGGKLFDNDSIVDLLTNLEDESGFNRDMAEMDQQNHQWDEQDIEEYQERWK